MSFRRNRFFIALALAFPLFFIGMATFVYYEIQSIDISLVGKYPLPASKIDNKLKFKVSKTRPTGWTQFQEISPYAIQSIVISEDWAFFDHEGLDIQQLKKIFFKFFRTLSFHRGGSTITQQLVKNLYFSHERSYLRKIKEMLIAYKIEQKYSKNRILEVYLNIIEFGENLFGIENASLFYFKKPSSLLTMKEGAFLAMLLPNPRIYSESFRNKELTEYAQETIESISIKLRQAKFLTEEERLIAMEQRFFWENQPVFDEIEAEDLWQQ